MKFTPKKQMNLLEAVMEMYHGISRQKAKQIISHSVFTVNNKDISGNVRNIIDAGDTLEMIAGRNKNNSGKLPSKNDPVVIYFEDDHLIVLLKPAGIISCATREMKVNNSFHKLAESFLWERDDRKTRLYIIHRLDREVEGLIVFAKSEQIRDEMKEKWPEVVKMYLAITEKMPDRKQGIIENWLRDSSTQKMMEFKKEVPGSKFAKTEFRWIKPVMNYHLLEITLHTGRKNQIRVHLAGIDCPIVGDRKYGADATLKRQIRLAANRLEFNHPVTGEKVRLEYKPSKRFFEPSAETDEKYKII